MSDTLAQRLLDVGYAQGCGKLSERQLKEVLVATANSVLVPACRIPTGLTANWNLDGTLDVSWDAVPVGMTNTEVWISSDDVTYVLADTVAAPGTTSHTGADVFDPHVKIRFTVGTTNCTFTASTLAVKATVPVPTGFTFVESADHTLVNVGWDATPANIFSTEIWTSTDNVTFALETTVLAPGVTGTVTSATLNNTKYGKLRWFCQTINAYSAFTTVLSATNTPNARTTDWVARVVANGGATPSNGTQTVINDFYNSIDACGIASKILNMAIFVPDSIIAARTPVFKAVGNDPWGTGSFVGADLGANGLTGGGKYLDPGCTPAFMGGQWTLTSCCIFFYSYTTNTLATGTDVGCTDGTNDSLLIANFNAGGLQCFSDLMGSGARLSVATPGNGFYMASRIPGANKIYFANSGTPWASIGSNNIGSSGFSTVGHLVFAYNNNGSIIQGTNATLSCAGFAAGLTTTEGQCLYNAVQACRVALGGGFR